MSWLSPHCSSNQHLGCVMLQMIMKVTFRKRFDNLMATITRKILWLIAKTRSEIRRHEAGWLVSAKLSNS
jgi:hypothetical protein